MQVKYDQLPGHEALLLGDQCRASLEQASNARFLSSVCGFQRRVCVSSSVCRLLKIFGRAIPYPDHQPAMEMRDRPADPRFVSDDPGVLHVLPWIQSSALYSTIRCGGSVTSWAQGLEPTPLAACEALSLLCTHCVQRRQNIAISISGLADVRSARCSEHILLFLGGYLDRPFRSQRRDKRYLWKLASDVDLADNKFGRRRSSSWS